MGDASVCVCVCVCIMCAKPLSLFLLYCFLTEWGLIANYSNQFSTSVHPAGSTATFKGDTGKKNHISEGVELGFYCCH